MKSMEKWCVVVLIGLLFSGCAAVRMIECDTQNEDGSHVRITNQERLFGGAYMRLCEYITPEKQVYYGFELDIYDRVLKSRKGNLFTIEMADGQVITLKNLYDAKAEVTEKVEMQTQTNVYTDFVPVYDAWYDAVYSVPVSGHYRSSRPTVRRESTIKMYYIVTQEQLKKIESGEVESIRIVGDDETLQHNPSHMSEQVRALDFLLTGGAVKK